MSFMEGGFFGNKYGSKIFSFVWGTFEWSNSQADVFTLQAQKVVPNTRTAPRYGTGSFPMVPTFHVQYLRYVSRSLCW